MCSYFSMFEQSILGFYFLALRYVKAFPAGAVRPAHRMKLTDEVSKKCLPHQHDLSAYLFLRYSTIIFLHINNTIMA